MSSFFCEDDNSGSLSITDIASRMPISHSLSSSLQNVSFFFHESLLVRPLDFKSVDHVSYTFPSESTMFCFCLIGILAICHNLMTSSTTSFKQCLVGVVLGQHSLTNNKYCITSRRVGRREPGKVSIENPIK